MLWLVGELPFCGMPWAGPVFQIWSGQVSNPDGVRFGAQSHPQGSYGMSTAGPRTSDVADAACVEASAGSFGNDVSNLPGRSISVCFVALTNDANANFKVVASLYGSDRTVLTDRGRRLHETADWGWAVRGRASKARRTSRRSTI